MKDLIAILGAAAALIAIADYVQRKQAEAQVSTAAAMNSGAAQSMRWWEVSGSPDKVMAQKCSDCAGGSQWGQYGVLPKYPF